MEPTIELRVAELLASRLCHDLISPVGAVNSGIELMTEFGDDPDGAINSIFRRRARLKPSCFIGGSRDATRHFVPGHDLYEDVGRHCEDLRVSRVIAGVGHWVQQEAPEEVTAYLLEFLESLP